MGSIERFFRYNMNNDFFDYYDDIGYFGNLNEFEYYNYYSVFEFIFYYMKIWKIFVDGYVYFVIVMLILFLNCVFIYGIVDWKCIFLIIILLFSFVLLIFVSCFVGFMKFVYLILWGNEIDKLLDYWCSVFFIVDFVGVIVIFCGNWIMVFFGI